MSSQMLLDYKSILENNKTELLEGLNTYCTSDSTINNYIEKIKFIYSEKLDNVKPYIMVYGIFNAGKSSIINELLGRDAATVNDKPETDSINEYEWNGYTIADTPGVGAPIEHQNVTNEHLRKADIVLFVMSSTGSTEKDENYKCLKRIIDLGKKAIIILNDKNGDMGTNDEALEQIVSKVKYNMKSNGINSEDFIIITVNAQRAKSGRIKGKEAFIKKSNIIELKHVILSELRKTNNYFVINNAVLDILNQLSSLQSYIERYNNESELISLNDLLNQIRSTKNSLKNNMREFIKVQINKLLPVVESDIWEHRENENQVSEIINKHLENLSIMISKELQEEIYDANENIFEDISNVIRELEDKIKTFEIDSKHSDFVMPNKNEVNVLDSSTELANLREMLNTSQQLLESFNKDKSIIPIVATGLGLQAVEVTGVVEAGTAIAAALAKTSLGTAILSTSVGGALASAGTVVATTLSTVAPYLAPILVIGGLFAKLLGSGKSEKELQAEIDAKNEAERRFQQALKEARVELHSKLEYAFDNISTEIQKEITQVIDDVIGNYEKIYGNKLALSKNTKEQYDGVTSVIQNVYNRYEQLSVSLRANN
ncbi:GTPase [Veillonella caviae]|uniref:GTPase n=1 Tax=Veillonella caviae TaxID=248316 RepID=UPI000F8F16DF|nr:GTPase [Veillonella caviae]MDY6225233.1 GTPase [Veillonella caviae]